MSRTIRQLVKAALPAPARTAWFAARYGSRADAIARARYLLSPHRHLSFGQRWMLTRTSYTTRASVDLEHTEEEMIALTDAIVAAEGDGVVVEAGCFCGGSTAKLSLACRLSGRRLVVFDSFEGLPPNGEEHTKTIFGETPNFSAGRYAGSLDHVKANVERYGAPEVCEYVKGWFDDTMPSFKRPIVAAFFDVDLVSSTRTCLKYLWPLFVPGGVLMSHDGHLPLVQALFADVAFWRDELGIPAPEIEGLRVRKLVAIRKR